MIGGMVGDRQGDEMGERDRHEERGPEQVDAAEGVSSPRLDLRPERIPQLFAPRAAGVAGILFAVLLVASFLLIRTPPPGMSDADTYAWFEDHLAVNLTVVGLYLMPLAGIAFLWFIAVIRDRMGQFEDKFFATIFLGTGILFIAMVFAGMAAAGSLVAGHHFYGDTGYPDAGVIHMTRSLSSTLIFVYGAKMAGAFVLVTDTIAFRTRIFSRWVSLIGYAVGLVLLFNWGFDRALVSVFPAWVVLLSVYILVTHNRVKRSRLKATRGRLDD